MYLKLVLSLLVYCMYILINNRRYYKHNRKNSYSHKYYNALAYWIVKYLILLICFGVVVVRNNGCKTDTIYPEKVK